MFGTISKEEEVNVSSSKAWALYGTLEIGKLLSGKTLEAVEVVEGDGGPGTVLNVKLKPGSKFSYWKEKFTKVDDANMVKEAKIVEGGFLDFGFDLYMIRIEIKENPKDDSSSACLVKLTIEYEIKEEFVANVSLATVQTLISIMSVAKEHLLKSN